MLHKNDPFLPQIQRPLYDAHRMAIFLQTFTIKQSFLRHLEQINFMKLTQKNGDEGLPAV